MTIGGYTIVLGNYTSGPDNGDFKGDTSTEVVSNFHNSVPVGALLFVLVAIDNNVGTGGSNRETPSTSEEEIFTVTDDGGTDNKYIRVTEYLNTGTAGAGVAVSLWYCVTRKAITASSLLSVHIVSTSSKAISVRAAYFTLNTGSSVRVAGYTVGAADGSTTNSLTLSGLESKPYLWLRAVAVEHPFLALTPSGNFTDMQNTGWGDGTTGGGNASNVSVRGEYRITTATSQTSNPSWTSADNASIFVAFEEEFPAPNQLTLMGYGI